MPKIIDLTGKTFGELTVLGPGESRPRVGHVGTMKMWRCLCVCGKEVQVETQNLKRRSPSCGCLKGDKISRALRHHAITSPETFPRRPKVRAEDDTPGNRYPRQPESCEKLLWRRMHKRCNNPTAKDVPYYGGVKVCDRWSGRDGYLYFLADMGPRPTPQHSIDRYPNGSGDYEPGNVRWATKKEQSQNRRNTHWLTFDGRTMCAADWAKELGINVRLLYGRIKAGLPVEKVLSAQRIGYKDRRWNPRRSGSA